MSDRVKFSLQQMEQAIAEAVTMDQLQRRLVADIQAVTGLRQVRGDFRRPRVQTVASACPADDSQLSRRVMEPSR